jgi:hypothetical protein
MGMLLTASVLFLLTLVLPAFAGANGDDERSLSTAERIAQREQDAARFAEQRHNAARASLEEAIKTEENLKDRIVLQRQLNELTHQEEVIKERAALAAARAAEATALATKDFEGDLEGLSEAVKKASSEVDKAERKFQKFKRSLNESDAAVDSLVGDMMGLLGVTDDVSSSFTLTLAKAFQNADGSQKSLGEGFKNLMTVMSSKITPLTFVAAQLKKVTEASIAVAKAQDQAISSFMRATGVNAGYDDTISETFMSLRHLGVSMQEAGASATALYTEMASFSRESRRVQTDLVRVVSLMGEVGISASTAAQALDTLTKTLGMSAIEAGNLSERMVQMAVDIGIPPQRLMQELAATAPMLAQWGDQTVSVFLDLERAAKATGLAVNELIGITKQYDTFRGAAEAAGRLNAVLGGPYLNSIELLNANEEERIRLLIQSIELSGRSWESLGRFERQAVAAAAGISDMSAASRIFGQSLSEYDRAQRAARANAEEQRNLAERAAEAQTVYETMTAALNSLAVSLAPLVTFLKGFFGILAKISSIVTDSPILSFLTQAGLTLKTIALTGPALLSLGKNAIPMLFGLGTASTTASVGMRALGAAIRYVTYAVGIGILLELVGALVGHFAPRSPPFSKNISNAADSFIRFGAAISGVLAPIRELSKYMPIAANAVVTIGRVDASEAMKIKTKAIPLMAGISMQEVSQMKSAAASAAGMMSTFNAAQRSVSSFIQTATGLYPALSGLADSIPAMAMTLKSTVTADSSEILRARAAGLSEIRSQNTDLRDGIQRLIKSNEFYSRRVEAAATKDTVLTLNGRELGRATKAIVNRELRQTYG